MNEHQPTSGQGSARRMEERPTTSRATNRLTHRDCQTPDICAGYGPDLRRYGR